MATSKPTQESVSLIHPFSGLDVKSATDLKKPLDYAPPVRCGRTSARSPCARKWCGEVIEGPQRHPVFRDFYPIEGQTICILARLIFFA
jgi:hypothetical protein